MRKKLLLLTTLLAITLGLRAENADGILSVTNIVNAIPGYTEGGSLDIVLNQTNTTDWASFQFDIQLPDGITYTGYEPGELIDGHTFNVASQGNNTTRISAANTTTSTNFKAKQGRLATIKFAVAGGKALNTYQATLSTIRVSLITSTTYNVADFNFNIEVSRKLTLDENKDYTPVAIENVNAYVNRPLNANTWSTIVHPFPMTAAQVTETFGEGTRIGYFTGMEPTYVGENLTSVSVNFTEQNEIAAHTPYIIKVPTAKPEGYTVNGVNVTEFEGNYGLFNTESKPLNKENGDPVYEGPAVVYGEMKSKKVGPTTKYYYDVDTSNDMIGTYKPMTIPNYYLFLNNNSFIFSKGKSKLKGFRACFYDVWVYYEDTGSRQFIINFNDGSETTGVKIQKNVVPNDNRTYSLTGQLVKNPAKGIYINNGKKVIIK